MPEDSEEMKAIDGIYGKNVEALKVGSMKSNYGHMESAAGMEIAILLASLSRLNL